MYVVRDIVGHVYAYRACPKTEEIGITFPDGKNNPLKLEDTDFRDIKAGAEPYHIPSLWNYYGNILHTLSEELNEQAKAIDIVVKGNYRTDKSADCLKGERDGFLKAKEVVDKIWAGQCEAITAESLTEAFCGS